jgi:hypothetical protein
MVAGGKRSAATGNRIRHQITAPEGRKSGSCAPALERGQRRLNAPYTTTHNAWPRAAACLADSINCT